MSKHISLFKKIVFCSILAVSGVKAQDPVVLTSPVKEQTGMYLVRGSLDYNFGEILPNTGVALEVAEPPSALVPGGPPNESIFVFATFYKYDGTYFVLSGRETLTNLVEVTAHRVDGSGETIVIGSGSLLFDPLGNGNAKQIQFDVRFLDGEEFFDSPFVSGIFERSVDVQINRCKLAIDFSPIDPAQNKPCIPSSLF